MRSEHKTACAINKNSLLYFCLVNNSEKRPDSSGVVDVKPLDEHEFYSESKVKLHGKPLALITFQTSISYIVICIMMHTFNEYLSQPDTSYANRAS